MRKDAGHSDQKIASESAEVHAVDTTRNRGAQTGLLSSDSEVDFWTSTFGFHADERQQIARFCKGRRLEKMSLVDAMDAESGRIFLCDKREDGEVRAYRSHLRPIELYQLLAEKVSPVFGAFDTKKEF